MRLSRLPYTIPGQLITALLGGVMILGSAGCNGLQVSLGGGGTTTNSLIGFLINSDTVSQVLGALRTNDGNEVYVYGTHKSDGNVDDVQAAVFRDSKGQRADVNFDGGLLSKAKSFDGSTLAVTYDERTAQRLRGHVDIFFATADPADQNQTIPFDIDLQQALADLAQQIEDQTGIKISTGAPPTSPSGGGREIIADSLVRAAKAGDRSAAIVVFAPFFVYAFASVGYVMVQVMAKFVEVMVQTILAITKVYILALCTPFLLMGELMRGSTGLPVFGFNFVGPLAASGVLVPSRPYL